MSGGHHHRHGLRGRLGAAWGMFLSEVAQNGKPKSSEPVNTGPVIRVALAGNPNAGKTSLFNAITGQHQHIGNYPGVTVEKKVGTTRYQGYRIEIVDLPGTYSLTAYSPEEVVTRDFLLADKPDVIVDVIDSTNLERNLYLCLQFQELGIPVLGALNMSDEAESRGLLINERQLGTILGIPFVKTVGTRGDGIATLLEMIVGVATGAKPSNGRNLNYGREIEHEIEKLIPILKQDLEFANKYVLRWLTIKLLEEDQDAIRKVWQEHSMQALILRRAEEARVRIRKHFREDCVVVVGEQRYAYIHGACHEAVGREKRFERIPFTERIDTIVLHRFAGVFIFFAAMFLVYQVTFAIGNPLSDLLDHWFSLLGGLVRNNMREGALRDLIADGIIGGVGGVLVFFPIVLMLFMSLSFLEDSGYMARAAFVMDKFFHLFGLHGRSFIPFMIATGCAVPAVLSARTLVNPRDRANTIMVTPLMMCGAKSPVVAMLAAAFFPDRAGLVFWIVWLVGWLLAFVIALVFRKTLFRGETSPFVMELPPYRFPTWRGVFTHMIERSMMYVRKAGTIILGISLVVWFLLYFPRPADPVHHVERETKRIEQLYQSKIAGAIDREVAASESKDEEFSPAGDASVTDPILEGQKSVAELEAEMRDSLAMIEAHYEQQAVANSFAGTIGHFLEPVFRPAGYDWRIVVGLFGGLAAKEVIISTLGIVYGVGEADPDTESIENSPSPLKSRLSGDPGYSPAMALSLMFFVLIYVPCMATLAVVKKELGSWKWAAFLAVYTLLVAYGFSVGTYQIGLLLGLGV